MSLSTNAQSAEEAQESRLSAGLSALILKSRVESLASAGSDAGERLWRSLERGTPSLRPKLWIESEPV